jgi:hypothetical protein
VDFLPPLQQEKKQTNIFFVRNRVTRLGEISPTYWAIVYFELFYAKYSNFVKLYFLGKSCVLVFAKSALGYILGDIFFKLIWVTLVRKENSGIASADSSRKLQISQRARKKAV